MFRRISLPWLTPVTWAALTLATVAEWSTTPARAELVVTRGDLPHRFLLTGELAARDAALLVAPNANIWPLSIRWLEEDGAEVSTGDPIVEFDNSQLATNLEELERAAVEAQSQLTSLQATVRAEEIETELVFEQKKADLDKARLDASVPPELLSEQEFEERRLTFERAELELKEAGEALELKRASTRARLEKQKNSLEKAKRAAQRARHGIELLTLEAPRDGILLVSDNWEEGRPYESGDSCWPGLIIARIPELSSMMVEAQLFDVDDGQVRPGMPVQATVDAFPDVPLSGEILETDSIAKEESPRSARRVFRTLVRVDGLDYDRMRPGMSVKIVVEDRREDVLLIPRVALDWMSEQSGSSIVAARPGGDHQPVTIGPCDATRCVLEDGLIAGDRVVAVRHTPPASGLEERP